MKSKEEQGWGSRLGFILAALGAMIGSGNIWRFPRVVALNGGGVFFIPYTIALVTVAVPLLIAEGIIGRETRHGPILGFAKWFGKKYAWLGGWLVAVNFLIMLYYSIVAGWALFYFAKGLTGFYGTYVPGMGQQTWNAFISSKWQPLLCGVIVWILTWIVLVKGTKGIEKVCTFMVPSLFIFLAIVAIRALTMPHGTVGLTYLYKGDVSKLFQARTWLEAYSQILWSTGAGWGIYTVYSSFLRKNDDINLNAHITGWGNCSASQFAGLAVIPTVAAIAPLLGVNPMDVYAEGNTGLSFIWLTEMLPKVPGGIVIGPLFYLALFFAAFSSQIAITEVIVKFFEDFGISVRKAVTYTTIIGLIGGIPAALSLNWLNNQDWVWGCGLLISSVIVSVLMVKSGLEKNREIANRDSDIKIGKWWDILLGYVSPISIVIILALWIKEAISWYPGTWWKITETYSVGTMLFQWIILAVILYVLLNKILMPKIEARLAEEG